MNKTEFLNIIREYPDIAQMYNNQNSLVKFPSSFGVYQNDGEWCFYEIDERQNIVVQERFENEKDAYNHVLKRYRIVEDIVEKVTRRISTSVISARQQILRKKIRTSVRAKMLGYSKSSLRRYGKKCDSRVLYSTTENNRQRVNHILKKEDK